LLDAMRDLNLRADADGFSVAGVPLAGYDSPLAESLIKALARRAGCTVGPARISSVVALLARGESGTSVPLGAGWRAELDFGRLRISRGAAAGADVPWALEGMSGQGTWGRWRLRWRLDSAPERQERAALVAWFTRDSLEVRGWSPGDRVRPIAGTGRRLVARCFQDAKVSRRRREGWPVIAGNGVVVWIPGVCRSDALLPHEGAEAVRVDAEYT
jgi:tRNA(Ile)-lysidine synthetase-like protein